MRKNIASAIILIRTLRKQAKIGKINALIKKLTNISEEIFVVSEEPIKLPDSSKNVAKNIQYKDSFDSIFFIKKLFAMTDKPYLLMITLDNFEFMDILLIAFIQTIKRYNAVVLRRGVKLDPFVCIYNEKILQYFSEEYDDLLSKILERIPKILVINDFAFERTMSAKK